MDAYTQPPAAPAAPPAANPLGLSLANMLAGGGKFTNPAYATPAQRAELYKYANAMLAPQTVKNGWQGLAEMARALIGGYASNKADLWEQAASLQGKTDIANGPIGKITAPGTSAAIPPAYNVAPAEPHSASSGGASSASITGDTLSDLKNGIANNVETPGYSQKDSYLAVGPETRGDRPYGRYQVMGSNVGPWTKEVIGHALTPEQFLHDQGAQEAVASGKLSQLLSQYGNPKDAASVWLTGRPLSTGANAKDINGMSGQRYADLATQGMGASAAPAGVPPPIGPNGLAVPLPDSATAPGRNYPAVVANDAKEGDAWLAAHGGAPSAYAPSPAPAGASPAAAAIGAPGPGLPALAQPARPMTMAQNASGGLPVSAGAIGEFLGNPNIDPEVKKLGMELINPKPLNDVTGNTYISRQFQPPPQTAPPFFAAGAPGPISDPGHSGIPSPSTITGTPTAPELHPMPNTGGGAAALRPGTPSGDALAAGRENAAEGDLAIKQTSANNDRYQRAIDTVSHLQDASRPLRQLQGILEMNKGELPTGEGADKVLSVASLGDMIATMLGKTSLAPEDSRLTQMQLLRKYGNQVAQSLTGRNTDLGSEQAENISPGLSLNQSSNIHLVDNYVRLNQLAQIKAAFEQDYFQKARDLGVPVSHIYDHFNDAWQKRISGPNAFPLSKFGRPVTLKSGKPGVYVPSTDPSGFSLFPADDPMFQSSVMSPGVK